MSTILHTPPTQSLVWYDEGISEAIYGAGPNGHAVWDIDNGTDLFVDETHRGLLTTVCQGGVFNSRHRITHAIMTMEVENHILAHVIAFDDENVGSAHGWYPLSVAAYHATTEDRVKSILDHVRQHIREHNPYGGHCIGVTPSDIDRCWICALNHRTRGATARHGKVMF